MHITLVQAQNDFEKVIVKNEFTIANSKLAQ